MDFKTEFLETTATPTLVAFLAYTVRVIIRRQHITFFGFLLDAISAVFVGIVVGNIIYVYNLPEQVHIAVISLSGMIGPDLLAGLLVLTNMFKNSPSSFIIKHARAWRGKEEGTKINVVVGEKVKPEHNEEES